MKLTSLSVDSFLQIKGLDLNMEDKPIHLIAGLNECGKSSLHEAIRFAYLGETQRVTLKRDYKMMIRDGAKHGSVRIDYVDSQGNHDFIKRDVATGAVEGGYDGDPEFAIAHVMDATRVPLLGDKQQRDFLLEFLGVTMSKDSVTERMKRKGVSDEMIEQVVPLLRAGFAAAHNEASTRRSQARGMWEQLTKQKWGSQKGGTWKPEKRIVVQPALAALKKSVEKYRAAYQETAEQVGKEYYGGLSAPCPECGTRLVHTGQTFMREDEQPTKEEMTEQAPRKLKRDEMFKMMEEAKTNLDVMQADIEFNEGLIEMEAESRLLHDKILKWMQVTDLLAPDGIPGEILADALTPMNDRMRHTASVTGWDQVCITPTMQIMIGSRPYSLGSESSQWRAQAAIAEAISFIGEIGLVCLDRFDVLDTQNRNKLLNWMQSISEDHATILLFGTLKEPPKRLPPAFALHWLSDGAFVEQAA